jgi:hypothetical protein
MPWETERQQQVAGARFIFQHAFKPRFCLLQRRPGHLTKLVPRHTAAGKRVLRAAVARLCWARTLQWIFIWL